LERENKGKDKILVELEKKGIIAKKGGKYEILGSVTFFAET